MCNISFGKDQENCDYNDQKGIRFPEGVGGHKMKTLLHLIFVQEKFIVEDLKKKPETEDIELRKINETYKYV